MADEITVSKTLSIRDCGLKEGWLQDQIEKDPSILGLGELELVRREKTQSSGGRMDFLLQNPEDDSMYEVEVMLGETDESHIIRTIEYWDLERRRWPKRSHTAVLVAEHMNRRFFNVIQLLSLEIPIIAIQANIVEADGKQILHFTKILDVYQEPEPGDPVPPEPVGENSWQEKAPWTLDHAHALQKIFSGVLGEVKLRFTKNSIRFLHEGKWFFLLKSKVNDKSSFITWMGNEEMRGAKAVLDDAHIPFVEKPSDSEWPSIRLTVDKNTIQKDTKVFQEIGKLAKKSWQDYEELK